MEEVLIRFKPAVPGPAPQKLTLFLLSRHIILRVLLLVAARQEFGRSPPAERESFRVRLELGRGAGAPRGSLDVCSDCGPRCSARWL